MMHNGVGYQRLVYACVLCGWALVAKTQRLTNSYDAQAAANLTDWRSHLLEETLRQSAWVARRRRSNERDSESVTDQPQGPEGQAAFDLYNPVLACRDWAPTERIGIHTGQSKFVCNLSQLSHPCLVFSLGSANDYEFEEAVLQQTPCTVHTYDCTVDGHSIDRRHSFHKLCIGSAERAASNEAFVTVSQAVKAAGASKLHLLKMDIEAYEWDVIAGWREGDRFLPDQISFELHRTETVAKDWPLLINKVQLSTSDPLHWQGAHAMSIAHVSLLFMHLANLGYGLVAKEHNGQCCAEFTVLQTARPRSTRVSGKRSVSHHHRETGFRQNAFLH